MFRSSFAVFLLSLVPLGAQVALGDTLHGFCGSPTASSCTDVGITPTSANPPNFGFWGSPGASNQDFELVLMTPDNEVTPSSFSLTITGTNVTKPSVSVSSPFSKTAFTGGFLSAYLGLNEDNDNPYSSFIKYTTDTNVDPGATGYYVYTFDFGAETGNSGKKKAPPYFNVSSSIPLGSVFLGYEFDSSGNISGVTANSGAILEGSPNTSVPEPASALLVLGALLCALGVKKMRKPVRG